ncbi:MAG: hypothetical protein HKM93_23790 [Desulfobacteraceae bacterium]|nr:hypothetical protein [Desulfobacteraceae bacterium]
MKKWKCTVCGYIHTGDEPPDKCPVCGADKSAFTLVEEKPVLDEIEKEDQVITNTAFPADSTTPSGPYAEFTRLLTKYHAHPMAVHIPNGVLPLSVIFAFIAIFFHSPSFGNAAAFNMMAVFLAMPLVIYSGVVDWQNRFGGNMTSVFLTKFICAAVVLVSSLGLSIWWVMEPSIVETDSGKRLVFLIIHLFILCPAILAGFLGGKLVFPANDP